MASMSAAFDGALEALAALQVHRVIPPRPAAESEVLDAALDEMLRREPRELRAVCVTILTVGGAGRDSGVVLLDQAGIVSHEHAFTLAPPVAELKSNTRCRPAKFSFA